MFNLRLPIGISFVGRMFNFWAANKSIAYPIRHLTKTIQQDAAANSTSQTVITIDPQLNYLRKLLERYSDILNREDKIREKAELNGTQLARKSRKIISNIQSINKNNKNHILKSVENDLALVKREHICPVVTQVQDPHVWKFRQSYFRGVHDYVEAVMLSHFCKTGGLLSLEEINASIRPSCITPCEYLLVVSDLTGELMTLAMGKIACGEYAFVKEIHSMVSGIYRFYKPIIYMTNSAEFREKVDIILQNLRNIETARYKVAVKQLRLLKV